ncbi:hypothetical protein TPA0907_15010 [Micromonospora humidisoli]|uniref:Acyl-CoA carboxylase epsilon subunit n=1 Tax=Micromonospora humidisoli TaxID=2807622 RepID=A0ABS2JKX1_9ACTN|nr:MULTISPECIES: hypothetical protein [Micromonospora]MBM7086296.1 hypothetical protein [Micromonospora humidisoli]GHJ07134.1 hypothetical protein TPA0907_15010 [Micromonospora sp. AKA109]
MTGRDLRGGRYPQGARPGHGPGRPDRPAGDRADLTVRADATPEEIVAVLVAVQTLAAPPADRPPQRVRAARVAVLRRSLPVDRSATAWRRGAR